MYIFPYPFWLKPAQIEQSSVNIAPSFPVYGSSSAQ